MKRLKEKYSFLVRLGITATVLLFTQHALAAGTTAGTDVDNLATVNYDVGGNAQTEIESSPTGNAIPGANGTPTAFEVDNRVDFTVAQVGAAHTPVFPGETDAFVEFTLTNDGNSPMDFRMDALQLGSGDGAVNLLVDTDDDGLSDSEEVSLGMNPSASNRGDLAPYSMPNGTLNIADVLVMNRILLGDITATATEITLGDLNNNGSLDIGDQVLLLRMVTGIIPPP